MGVSLCVRWRRLCQMLHHLPYDLLYSSSQYFHNHNIHLTTSDLYLCRTTFQSAVIKKKSTFSLFTPFVIYPLFTHHFKALLAMVKYYMRTLELDHWKGMGQHTHMLLLQLAVHYGFR